MQEQARTPDGEQLMTKKDVARRAKCSERTVGYWIAMEKGGLPYVKLGRLVRVIPSDYERWQQSRRIGGWK